MKLASLKDCTQKDLARLAKEQGVPGWREMRKDELVRALARRAKAKLAKVKSIRGKAPAKPTNGHKSLKASTKPSLRLKVEVNGHKSNSRKADGHKANGHKAEARPASAKLKPGLNGHKASMPKVSLHKASMHKASAPAKGAKERQAPPKPKSPVITEKIQKINAEREHLKDLALPESNKDFRGPRKDRLVLLVRDPYWLHVCWELSRNSVERAKAALAEHWHTSRPVLRLLELGDGATTSSSERVVRDIEIHGGVQNWYIDVQDPPKHYRVALGYLAASGRFYALCRSNSVTTPTPGSSDDVDKNWSEVAKNYEKIYALSGGYSEESAGGELQELFEERLRRPMGAPVVSRYGAGAERLLNRQREFRFEVEAEMLIYGVTKPGAYVTLAGEPVKIRPDGTFAVRLAMPDKRQVLPVVASSSDGIEQRTVVIAVERNTKVMEPMIRDGNE